MPAETAPLVITVEVPGSEVRPGDDYEFLGAVHRITRVEPYSHPVVTGGEAWLSASADTSERLGKAAWGITIHPGKLTRVTRVAPDLTHVQRTVLRAISAAPHGSLNDPALARAAELWREGLVAGSPGHGYEITRAGYQVLGAR